MKFPQNRSKCILKVPDRSGRVAGVPGHVFHRIMTPRSAYKKFLKIEFSTLKVAFYCLKPILASKKLFLLQQNGQNSPGSTTSMIKPL